MKASAAYRPNAAGTLKRETLKRARKTNGGMILLRHAKPANGDAAKIAAKTETNGGADQTDPRLFYFGALLRSGWFFGGDSNAAADVATGKRA